MKHFLVFPAAFIVCIPAAAALTDREVAAVAGSGASVESRIDGDFNGDGRTDTAFIAVGADDDRRVHVLFGDGATGRRLSAGSFMLPPDRLGPAEMSVNKDVLVIKDLTGGTTALAATYRFRGDAGARRMRLIGLDAKLYSRTYAHDGAEMSWNLLTGDIITAALTLRGSGEDATYDRVGGRRFRRPIATVYMEDTPDAEAELAAATRK